MMKTESYRLAKYPITVEINEDGQFVVSPDSTADEVFDSWQELVEAHPVCEEAHEFFSGEEAEAFDAEEINVGDRVEGGEPGTDDYDTGRVDAITGKGATVAWDSGVTTYAPLSVLRKLS